MILRGDCREMLPTLAPGSVHCCVTSPPYFGLRSYLRADHPNKAKEIGSEQLHDCLGWVTGVRCGGCFVCVLVEVFNQVRRVLRDDGVLWVNLGDCYAGSGRGGNTSDESETNGCTLRGHTGRQRTAAVTQRGSRMPGGLPEWSALGPSGERNSRSLKQKDLMGIPWRVALALQGDGWYWRDTVVWHKPNPMPSSVADRCTPAWEPVLMFTKSRRYYFDWEAIAQVAMSDKPPGNRTHKHTDAAHAGKTNGRRALGLVDYAERERSRRNTFSRETKATVGDHGQKPQHRPDREPVEYTGVARPRNVWTIPTQPFSEAHFATFPEALPERCILATCPPCGTVLDPFVGSGTTYQVARRLGRECIGIDLDESLRDMQERRALSEPPGLPLGAPA